MEEVRKSFREKIIEAYKKYAPKNITLEQFIDMIENDPMLLRQIEDNIFGDFSTFDFKLSRRFKELDRKSISSKDGFRHLLKDSLNGESTEKRAKDLAKIYEEVISSDDEILTAAWTFDTLTAEQKNKLAIRIVNALNKYFNIKKTLDVNYVDKAINRVPDDSFEYKMYDFIQNFMTKVYPKKSKYGRINGYWKDSKKELVIAYKESFEKFISVLSHEYGHFIDDNYPDLGMLGSQIAHYGNYVYDSHGYHERYLVNPTEFSSFKIGAVVSAHLELALQEQAKKKPELYIKTIKSALDRLNAECAGAKLKWEKVHGMYNKIKDKMRRRKYEDFYDLSERKRNKIWKEVEKDPRLKEYEQIKNEYYSAVFDLRDKKIDADSFHKLSDQEQDQIYEDIDKDPSVADIKSKYEALFDLRLQIRDEKYPDFYDLSEKQRQKILTKVEKNPLVKVAEWGSDLAWHKYYKAKGDIIARYKQLLEDFEAEQAMEKAELNKEGYDR